MARRSIKLQIYDYRVTCPYCRANVVFPSVMQQIHASRRNCPVCAREMLIEDGRAVKLPAEGARAVRLFGTQLLTVQIDLDG